MNNEVFQEKFMVLNFFNQERFLPILKDSRLFFRFDEFYQRRTDTQEITFLSTNTLNVGDEFEIVVPELVTNSHFRELYIHVCGLVDIDVLGRKVDMRVHQLQKFNIKIISKEELLEKIGDQINFSVSNTIQKYPAIVRKIK